jgi:hypothetical protein
MHQRESPRKVFLHFPKVEQDPASMDHAVLQGKLFGIPLTVNVSQQ